MAITVTQTLEILNKIRSQASEEYQERIPEATQATIASIGNSFESYTNLYNEYSNALLHKIGLTLIQAALWENPLANFKTGSLVTGQDVEEIFVDMFREAEGQYDQTGVTINPFARREYQDVKVNYHRMNRRDKYVISINQDDHIRAFRSAQNLSMFYTAQLNSLYNGANFDEFNIMKEMLAEAVTNQKAMKYEVPAITDTESCKTFVKSVKKAIADFKYPSKAYNAAGMMTFTKKENLVLFVHKDLPPHLDVDLYGTIFGADYAKMGITVVEVDNFGSLDNGTVAILADKEWFKIWDVKFQMEQLFNPDNMVMNYWLHVWQILSTSNFKNMAYFAPKA